MKHEILPASALWASKVAYLTRRVRPLRERVCIKPLPYKHSILEVVGIQLHKGIVVAAGPGRRVRRRIPWKLPNDVAQASSVLTGAHSGQTFYVADGAETGRVEPMPLKPGDCVEYGFRDVFEFDIDGERLLMVKLGNIYGTTNADQSDGIFEPKSAPIDLEDR